VGLKTLTQLSLINITATQRVWFDLNERQRVNVLRIVGAAPARAHTVDAANRRLVSQSV